MSYDFLNERGIVAADTSQTQEEVFELFRSVFGADIDMSPETIQGVIAAMFIEQRDNVMRTNVELANQINPDFAQGIFLDGLVRFLGGTRKPSTHTMINGVEMRGVAGTIIPKGSIATAGIEEFALTSNKVIGDNGVVYGDFKAVKSGSIEVLPHEIDTVASSVLGWETVDNPSAGITGKSRETDNSLRLRRERTLGLQGVGEVENIISGLFDIREVHSLSFYENKTSEVETVDGISVNPHGLYTCIFGGSDEDIALVFNKKKNIGSTMTGSTVAKINDPITGVEYTVNFDRPTVLNLFVRVSVKESTLNAQFLIPDIVQRWADGLIETDAGLVVGRDVSPFEIASAINSEQPTLYITKVEISTDGVTYTSDTLKVKINEIAHLGSGSVIVRIV